MKIKSLAILISCAGTLLSVSVHAASETPADEVWMLTQESRWAGKQDVYVQPKLMRLKNDGFGFNAVLSSEKKTVEMYNKTEKIRFVGNTATWGDTIRAVVATVQLADGESGNLVHYKLNWKKGELSQFQGVNVRKYTARSSSRGVTVDAACLVAEDIKTDPALYGNLSSMNGFPACPGLAVDVTYTDNVNGKVHLLKTLRVKKVKLPADLYKIPMSYRLTQKGSEVIIGGSTENALGDFVGSLGDDTAAAKTKPKKAGKEIKQ